MRDASINKKVITSYVSANTTTLGALAQAGSINADRPVYTNAWLDIASTSYFYAPSTDNLVGTYLWTCYKALAATLNAPTLYDAGVFGFTEEYWSIEAYLNQDGSKKLLEAKYVGKKDRITREEAETIKKETESISLNVS